MKKGKVILATLLAAASACLTFVALGCNKKDADGDPIYSQVYTADAAGINVYKTTTEYRLDGSQTANVALDDIVVKTVNSDGDDVDVLSSDKYIVKVFDGNKRLNDTTKLEGGSYNVWVKTKEAEPKEAFVPVYVIDEVVEFYFNKTAVGTVTSQTASVIDRMSDSWTFTARYKSGKSETVKLGNNVTVSDLITNEKTNSAAGRQATVTYVTFDSKGTKKAVSAKVSYQISEANTNVYKNSLSYGTFLSDSGIPEIEQEVVTQEQLDAVTDFLTLAGGTFISRPGQSGGCFEIKLDAFKVTFQGVGALVVTARSTSNSAYSALALRDEDGNYVKATFSSSSVQEGEDYCYTVTGGSFVPVTFIVLKPGTYTLCTVSSVTVGQTDIETNRNTRIQDVTITDER